ncbi:MAG: NADH-quinone oxidoreductase subunit M, partial [Thermodesulfobacteriota bacterium]
MENFPIITTIILAPTIAVLILLFVKEENLNLIRGIAVVATAIPLALSLYLLFAFDRAKGGFQFVEKVEWIKSLGVSYHVGADGIS